MTLLQAVSNKMGQFSQSSPDWKTNPWVWGWLGLVTLVLLVNIGMVALAVMTNPGLVVQDYYQQGRDHEQHLLQKIAAHKTQGWVIEFGSDVEPVVGVPVSYRLQVSDGTGLPLGNASVNLHAYRPSDASADFEIALAEFAPGDYRAELTLPLKGAWELITRVELGSQSDDLSQRVFVLGQ